MVDKKPVFKVKWHGENINCPRSSGNIRKILSKGEIVEADEDLIRRCMLYFTPILNETSDNILVCDIVHAAVMRKVIKLLEIGEIECTWEELEKIARALKVLSVRPYDVAEGESRVEISIVPHWCHTSRLEDITVYVKDFSTRVNRELLVEMSGQFEDLLKNHHGDTLRVPSATDDTLRWILDTIHLREIIVSTHRELLFSEFEEYCFCLEDFRIRQPSTKRNRSPSSERVRPPSSERVRPPSTEQSGQQSREQANFGFVMVDEKPDFKVKWHGENIKSPRLSGNIRKILSKGEIVEADETLIRRCMLYFTPIPNETSDNILVCDIVDAAVMRKVIKLLEIGEIECTWEELEKIARALKVLSVRPYDVAEGEARVEISIVPHWCHTSRPEDITVYVKDFSTRVNRELLVEMSGQFEDLLKNHHGDTLRVPSATDDTLRWILDTIHLREIIVSTHRELLFSEFEEYCFCLEDFRIRQPSSKRTISPSSERVRPPSTEQSRPQSSQQVSASINLDEQETRLPLVGECSTKAGTQDKAEPSSVKEDLSAKSAGSSPKSVGPSPKSHSQSPKGASPTPKKD